MSAEATQTASVADSRHHITFFRQSGWMMLTTMVTGVMMSLIHVFSKFIPNSEYSVMGTLFQLLNWMTIPAIGLQMTFAQQSSSAVTEAHRRQLAGTFRALLLGTFGVWLLMAVVTFFCQDRFISALKISNPAALWITVVVAWAMLWQPIFMGLLQGRQNFLWLGWVNIFNGVGRVVIAGVIVLVLGGWAAGIMVAVLIGMLAALGTAIWQIRDLWRMPAEPFDAPAWLRRVVPLTLGFGASQFLFSADLIMVQTYLGHDGRAAPYVFLGTLARSIVLFTGPLAAVMFPKLVHNAARSQKSNLLLVTLGGTAVLGALAALALTLTAPLLIKYGSKPEYVSIAPLMALFAWCMLPLAVANVLLNNLMAHSRFNAVPFLVAVVVGYWITLGHFHESFKMVIQVFGCFAFLFLVVCAVFSWGDREKLKIETDS